MNNPNPENPPPAPPVAQPAVDNRRRLRELLAIPERDRTDEQWDEIIELEIQLAPGNRIAPGDSGAHMPQGGGQKLPGQQPRKHRSRSNNRRQRPPKPTGNPA